MNAHDADVQTRYHRDLYGDFYRWDHASELIRDLTGDDITLTALGLDQLGHFGPHGCTRVVERALGLGLTGSPRIVELGAGFGGVLRYTILELAKRGIEACAALGVELSLEHCDLFARINDFEAGAGPEVVKATPLCATASSLPIADSSVDLVFAAGSASHLPDMGLVLAESRRVLAPGGTLVMIEEVSLLGPGVAAHDLSGAFIDAHPRGVFHQAERSARIDQLSAAGFRSFDVEALTDWAIELVTARLRALEFFYGTMANIIGDEAAARVVGTLEAARAEWQSGRIVPSLVHAVV